jgi:Serine aminopeptidase, S33
MPYSSGATKSRPTSADIAQPSFWLLGTEPFRAAAEYAALQITNFRQPVATPLGDQHPVVIFPGLASNGSAVAPLRKFCRSQGYAAYDWGRGYNTGPSGDVNKWLTDLAHHTEALIAPHAGKATLIGWSLGGFYARELGKLMAPKIRQVITIGTPFNAEADYTRVGWLYRLLRGEAGMLDQKLSRQLRTPPPVPTTSIYSRSDGIVAWETCCHQSRRNRLEDVEIHGSHIGMGWNWAVMAVVADRLALPSGCWKAYVQAS